MKEYTYQINGRKVIIKRKYKINGTRNKKSEELKEYFKNNAEAIKSNKKLNEVLETYNKLHDNKISYSMLYQYYKSLFGFRKPKKETKKNKDKEEQTDSGHDKPQEEEEDDEQIEEVI